MQNRKLLLYLQDFLSGFPSVYNPITATSLPPAVSKGWKKFPGKYSASIHYRNNRRKTQRKSVVCRRKKNG